MTALSAPRLATMIFLFLCLYCLSITNLFRLQIHNNDFFVKLAQQQYNVTITQTPARALIFDRHGQPLALNKESWAAFITPNNLENKKQVTAFLKKEFPQAYERLLVHGDDLFMYIKRRLSDEEIRLIEDANISDIHILQDPSRLYPVPSLGHTLGITDIDNKGISGIELMYEPRLAGQPTTLILEKDARSQFFYFKKNTTVAGHEGLPITLTIDAELQFLAYDELKEYVDALEAIEGEILIMDGASGDILAMACYPDFDPNDILNETSWKTKNRILTECYEFGSVMKIFPAMAALEKGLVTPDEIINCENRKETYINGIKVTTWKEYGEISFSDVIRHSNNIGTSKVALRLGKSLYDDYKKAGFASPSGLKFLGEQQGFITPPRKWSKATPISLSFGYEVSSNLLQLVLGFSPLTNNGITLIPRLFIDPAQPIKNISEPIYSPQTISIMREILDLEAANSNGKIPGYKVMGKTGSAYLITNGTYDTNRSIYTFVGIVEKGDYKRIIATFIREPKPTGKKVYAATVAMPLFKKIAQAMLIHDKMV